MQKSEAVRKFKSALVAGALIGTLAAVIVFMKGLNLTEVFAYFFFWIGASLIVSFTTTLVPGWLKGLILAEVLAVPVVVLSIGGYRGDPLYYVVLNIILINGFMGIALGYFAELSAEEPDKRDRLGPGVFRKYVISTLAGAAAGGITLIPIMLSHMPLIMMFSALSQMTMLSLMISYSNSPLKGWQTGLIGAVLTSTPIALIIYSYAPSHCAPMILVTTALGTALGAFNEKYARFPQ